MDQYKSKSESNSIKEIFSRLRDAYGDKATEFISLINLVKQFKGAESFFKDALGFDDIRDFIAVLIFASYFHHAECIVEFVPRSKGTTPDLFIANSKFRGFVETKHIHKKHDGLKKVLPNESETNEELDENGNYTRDERYCRDDIIKGFKQLRDFSGLQKTDWMIVAIWNSDEDLMEIDMKSSLNQLIKEKNEFKNMPNPKCIIYGSDWYSFRRQTQFYVFRF
jgi:hypothetical protein